MDTLGINWGFLIIQMLFVGSWPLARIIALLALRRSRLTGISQAVWSLIVVAIPILGALAYFIVNPIEKNHL